MKVAGSTGDVGVVVPRALDWIEISRGKCSLKKFLPHVKGHDFILGAVDDQFGHTDPGQLSEIIEMAGNEDGKKPEKLNSSRHFPCGGKSAFQDQRPCLPVESDFNGYGSTQGTTEQHNLPGWKSLPFDKKIVGRQTVFVEPLFRRPSFTPTVAPVVEDKDGMTVRKQMADVIQSL